MSSLKALASFIIATSLETGSVGKINYNENSYSFSESTNLITHQISGANPKLTVQGFKYIMTLDSTVGYINDINTDHENGHVRTYKLTKPKLLYSIHGINDKAFFRKDFGVGETDDGLISILSKRRINALIQHNLSPLDQIDMGFCYMKTV